MNRNVKILDCTLRDGGRIINCAFPEKEIHAISSKLSKVGIDYVEVGFLRDPKRVEYKGDSTFFTDVDQIRPYIHRENEHTQFVAFVDYELYDFSTLKPHDGTSIDGIRVGFKRNEFNTQLDEIKKSLELVKKLGYKLFIQGVNSLGYSDKEILELVDFINVLKPDAFGIVDTYGAMYQDDVERIFTMVDHNLDPTIAIDFHSHNNFQLSFALAQEAIRLSRGQRTLILDGTLNGMGKGAGNLNIELIVDYLNRKMGYRYDFDLLLDVIDEHAYELKKDHPWGYTIPAMMAGVFKSHPNNIIYLTEKFRLSTKDIRYILSLLDEKKRQSYDYDLIEKLYVEYNASKVDDDASITQLKAIFKDRPVLVLAPGHSIQQYAKQVDEYIAEKKPVVVSVNFRHPHSSMLFFGSPKRYEQFAEERRGIQTLVTSNVKETAESDIVIDYSRVIECGWKYFDNSSIMLLHLMRRCDVHEIAIAGIDGFEIGGENYFTNDLTYKRNQEEYALVNKELREMFMNYRKGLMASDNVKFIVPSQFANIFEYGKN